MSFYSSIVKAYDELFPLNKIQAGLIEGVFRNLSGKSVLDCGCGTGSLAVELGRRSASVRAFDLDETMIEKAKEKCPQAIDVEFSIDDLLKFDKSFPEESFHFAYCLGNTLAHLPSENEVKGFINSATKVLKPEGYLLIQVVNYDRVLKNKISQLPTIESDNYIFERNYISESHGIIQFSTVLKDKKSEQFYKQSIPLIPVLKDSLSKILQEQFCEIQFWGSFKQEKWTEDSFHTVVLAKKSTGQKV